jgi:hypothetical protein
MTPTYRVHVSTDLGGDPDDIQSLFRLIHYSDVLRVEGITSCTGPGSTPSASLIEEWIQRADVDHLRAHGHPELMTEQELLSVVRQGPVQPGAPTLSRRTPGSDLIIENALKESGEPLWVLVWGSITELAQALFDMPDIAEGIRINYIGSSNTVNDPAARDWVYDFMSAQFPDLWWIEDGIMPRPSHDTFRGIHEGGDQTGEWNAHDFVVLNIRGRGTTRRGTFAERCGDAFPWAKPFGGGHEILKEGDSPTILHLLGPLFGGVGDVDDPSVPGWGGQFTQPEPDRFPNYWTDLDADAGTCRATISRWRVPILEHWKERWGWYE